MKLLDGKTPVTILSDNGILASIMNEEGEKLIVFSFRIETKTLNEC